MDAAQLILFEEVRARRFCGKHGLSLREGCLKFLTPRTPPVPDARDTREAQSAGQADPL
jgi:hypothetical protein